MAAAATASPPNPTPKHSNAPRRRRLVGQRRRLGEDEASDDDGGHNVVDLVNDDSLTEGSIASDERDAANDSDTSNVDEASPTVPVAEHKALTKQRDGKGNGKGNGKVVGAGPGARRPNDVPAEASSNTADKAKPPAAPSEPTPPSQQQTPAPPPRAPQPAIVSSSTAQLPPPPPPPPQPQPRRETAYERQRREHELYRQKRDEDPSFVPNRGAFFMHDHRGAGPAANGFRPFGRPGRGGRGGRGGGFGPFSPLHNQFHNPADPTVNAPWAHDMHKAVPQQPPPRLAMPRRPNYETGSQYGGSQAPAPPMGIPTCPSSAVPINRSMSVEKQLGTVTVRVLFPPMKEAVFFEKFMVVQYTKLPDHRPPLRRDKAVVINLPHHPKRQIFPAADRSFIFIPRAMRPNQQQQRSRGGRARSVLGSISGFSHRTSVYGGSYYNGSMYSPSVALSRRSSIAQDVGRDFLISPTGSAVSRPPLAMDNAARPVVRLPPAAGLPSQPAAMMPVPVVARPVVGPALGPAPVAMPLPHVQVPASSGAPGSASMPLPNTAQSFQRPQQPPPPFTQAMAQPQPQPHPTQPPSQPQQPPQTQPAAETSSLSSVPPPQIHPLPQKPSFQETRPNFNLPMHQPRPQKTVSVENIESPATAANSAGQHPTHQPYPMPFHQQVPMQMAPGFPPTESHSRHPSYQSRSTGTPLSQIPERAIHAAPFQPTMAGQPAAAAGYVQPAPNTPSGPMYYGTPGGYPVMQPGPHQTYFYPTPPTYPTAMVASAAVPAFVPASAAHGPASVYGQSDTAGTPVNGQHNLVAREANGMVFYVDAAQLSGMASYPTYPQAAPQGGFMPGMGGMVTPAPAEGYYYGPQPGMMYYPQ